MILIAGPTPSLQRRMVFGKVIPNGVNRTSDVEQLVSGKGVNCARAVSNLGGSSLGVLFLGGDSGLVMKRGMEAEGLKSKIVEVTAPTRCSCTVVEREAQHVTELIENAGAVTASDGNQFKVEFEVALSEARVAVLMGTLPEGLEETFYRDLVMLAHARKVPSIVDAQGAALLAALQAKPLLIKPNRQELARATNIDCASAEGLAASIRFMHERGAAWVFISDEARAATLSDGKRMMQILPPNITVRNPVGSGDTVSAGVAVALSEGKNMIEAIRFGIACGAANAEGEGYGRICLKRVRELEREVVVR